MQILHALWAAPALMIFWALVMGMRDGFRETSGRNFSDPHQPFVPKF